MSSIKGRIDAFAELGNFLSQFSSVKIEKNELIINTNKVINPVIKIKSFNSVKSRVSLIKKINLEDSESIFPATRLMKGAITKILATSNKAIISNKN